MQDCSEICRTYAHNPIAFTLQEQFCMSGDHVQFTAVYTYKIDLLTAEGGR